MFLMHIRTVLVPLCFLLISSASATFNIAPDANPITEPAALPSLVPRQGNRYGATSCDSIMSISSRCQATVPNFDALLFDSRAKCFCYSSSSWAPSAYDHAFASCASFMKTISPSYYSASFVVKAWQTAPCSQMSAMAGIAILSIPGLLNFDAPLTAAAATVTAANSTTDLNRQACSSWSGIISSCSINDRSAFQTISGGLQHPVKEASCLCYTTGSGSILSYAPSRYDRYWSSCLSWHKTANSELYFNTILAVTSENEIVTPCAQFGDIIASESIALATMTDSATGDGFAPTAPAATNPVLTIATPVVAPNVANSATVGHVLGLASIFLALVLQQL